MQEIINNLKNHAKKNIDAPIFFQKSNTFFWNPNNHTIYYDPSIDNAASYLIHEYSHALMSHTTYRKDIELLHMESSAWQKAEDLMQQTGVKIDNEIVQSCLDSYRDWLHERSICPECSCNGVQQNKTQYICVSCLSEWKVNPAKTCRLKRTRIK